MGTRGHYLDSRPDNGRVEVACIWRTPGGWTGRRFHLGTKKEVFGAECLRHLPGAQRRGPETGEWSVGARGAVISLRLRIGTIGVAD